MHSFHEALLLFVAAIAGGVINSVAGGGGFICFPALLFTGVPPVNANATNTIALWPGTAASIIAYRQELRKQNMRTLAPLIVSSILGGITGALLLLKTPQATFLHEVPWLMLIATLLFILGGKITEAIKSWAPRSRDLRPQFRPGAAGTTLDALALDGAVDLEGGPQAGPGAGTNRLRPTTDDQRPMTNDSFGVPPVWLAIAQLIVAIYIGYFGAGAGIVILALLSVMGMQNIHSMNAIKVLLASSANGIALITFIVAHTIYWPQALLMLCGAILGGYGGAWYAQRLKPSVVRGFVIATGCVMTAYFFWKT